MPKQYSNKFIDGLMVDIDNHYMKNTSMKSCENFTLDEKGEVLALTNIKGHILRSKFENIPNAFNTERQSLDYIIGSVVFYNEIVFFGGQDTGYDSIITSARIDEDGNFRERLLWRGNFGWDRNTVITAKGNWENELYKRVYFTDAIGPIKSINLSLNNLHILWGKSENELSLIPEYKIPTIEVETKLNGGTLPVMRVQYVGRYISKSGAKSAFFPFSEMVTVNITDNLKPSEIEGGYAGENTGKFNEVTFVGLDTTFSDIEAYAIEYQAKNSITKIAVLGKRSVDSSVEIFNHTGDEITASFTVEELLTKNKNITFSSCNALEIKDNILIAGGLKGFQVEDSEFDSKITSWDKQTGGKSSNYNNGNGIELQIRPYSKLLTDEIRTGTLTSKAPIPYINTKSVLHEHMTLQRGETYRIGIQWESKNGGEYFNQFVGDVTIPKASDSWYISWEENGTTHNDGNGFRNTWITGGPYTEPPVYVRYVNLVVHIKITDSFRDKVSGFRMTYVERTRYNSTILEQGIAHPAIAFRGDKDVLGDNYTFYGKKGNEYYVSPGFNSPYYPVDTLDHCYNGTRYKSIRSYEFMYYDSVENTFLWETDYHNRYAEAVEIVTHNGGKTEINNQDAESIEKHGVMNSISKFQHTLFLSQYIVQDMFSDDNPKQKINKYKRFVEGGEYSLKDVDKTYFTTGGHTGTTTVVKEILNRSLSFYKRDHWFLDNDLYENNVGYCPASSMITFNNEFWRDPNDFNKFLYKGNGKEVTSERYIINITQDLEEQYGSDDEFENSLNRYIAASKFINVSKTSNEYECIIEGDRYMTLFQQVKVSRKGELARDKSDSANNNTKGWAYSVVLESSVPFEMSTGYRFNKDGINLVTGDRLELDEVFFTNDSVVSYRNKPYKFENIIDLKNIIAASTVKLNGEQYDSWAKFPVFDFHELDMDKGAVTNLAVLNNYLYSIQEETVSIIGMNSRALVSSDDGRTINIETGTGRIFEYHENISMYGTKFRNNKNIVPSGIYFVSEIIKDILLIRGKEVAELLKSTNNKSLLENSNEIKNINIANSDSGTILYFSMTDSDDRTITIIYNTNYKSFRSELTFVPDESISAFDKVYDIKDNKLYELGFGRNNLFDEIKPSKFSFVVNPEADGTSVFTNLIAFIESYGCQEKITEIRVIDNIGHTAYMTHSDRKYRIREGKHLIPIRDEITIRESLSGTRGDRIRGQWALVEMTFDFSNCGDVPNNDVPNNEFTNSYWCEDSLNVTNCFTGKLNDPDNENNNSNYIKIPLTELGQDNLPTKDSVIQLDDLFLSNSVIVKDNTYLTIFNNKIAHDRYATSDVIVLCYNGCSSYSGCNKEYDASKLDNGGTTLKPLSITNDVFTLQYDHTTDYLTRILCNFRVNSSYLAESFEVQYQYDNKPFVSAGVVSFNCGDYIDESFLGDTVELPYPSDGPDVKLTLRFKAKTTAFDLLDSEWTYISKTYTAYELGHYSQTSCSNNDC